MLLALVAVTAAAWKPVERHLQAAALLLRFEAPEATPEGLATFHRHAVDVQSIELQTEGGPIEARAYRPRGAARAPGVLLVHGVHHQGIDEPRLQRFARVVASSGIRVVTPAIEPLADYRLVPETIEQIGRATVSYADRIGRRRVGVMGISFSGGLALLAASRAPYDERTAFVLAVGAHHDLTRVLRWYATETVHGPESGTPQTDPHPYGAGVFVYTQLREFFPQKDLDTARRALELVLSGRTERARRLRGELSPQGQRTLGQILEYDTEGSLKRRFLQTVERLQKKLRRVSPRDNLGELQVPVFLVHGTEDPVVPSTETRWLAREVPAEQLENVVVTPFLRHAERRKAPSWRQRWELVHLMAEVLSAAYDTERMRSA